MNIEVKEHVSQINKGKTPQGYKKTKLGIIPEDWSLVKLGSIGEFKKGKGISTKDTIETGLPAMMYGDIYVKYNTQFDNVDFFINQNTANNSTKINKGDLLFTGSGETAIEIGKCVTYQGEDPIYIGGDIIGLTPEKNNSLFLAYQQNGYEQIKQKARFGQGHSVVHIYTHHIKSLIIALPQLLEQQKIAEIISTCDKLIELKENLIEKKKLQKKYLMQTLLYPSSPNFRRLAGFYGRWEKIKLGEIIKEASEKTNKNNQYPIFSITKNGIRKQSEYFKKQIASDDNTGYKIIRKDNLIFSCMNLWMGSLDILRDHKVGIVSPAYKTFTIDCKKNCINFICYYLKTHRMLWLYKINSEQGASIVRRNLDLKGLLSSKILIPEYEEQKAIANILSVVDKEINLLEKELEQQKLKKKALMQLLLTGKVRVNVS